MWKCGSRRFRGTVERGANHYDKCNSAGVNPPWCDFFKQVEKQYEKNGSPCCWFIAQKCKNSWNRENDTKRKRWNFEHLNRTWIGAIAWSSALVFGWYTSSIIHLKAKSNRNRDKFFVPKVYNVLAALPIEKGSQKYFANIHLNEQIEKFLGSSQIVHAISNDQSTANSSEITNSTIWSSKSGPLDSDLGDVLNSIENRLGLAEIESGHYQNGLMLLRSAANRDHAPAIYNLALCYETGLGVPADEKVAMEFYRTAASLHHPGALYNLGIYYGQGRGGLTRDHVTAMRLLKLAAVQGQQEAITALKEFESDKTDTSDHEHERDTRTDLTIDDTDVKSHPNNDAKDAPTHSSFFIQNSQLQNFNYVPIVF